MTKHAKAPVPHFHKFGKQDLPAWIWRELLIATQDAHGRPAVLVFDIPGGRNGGIAVLTTNDFNRLMSVTDTEEME